MPISDDYKRVLCADIKIAPDRQRTAIDIKDGFADSILRQGVLVPVILTRDLMLVAGERRLTASIACGHPDIPVRFLDELSQEEAQTVELQENLKRRNLDWQDEVRAIAKLHKAYAALHQDWSTEKTANELSLSKNHLTQILRVADYMHLPKVLEQSTWSSAVGVMERLIARKSQEAMSAILEITSEALSGAVALNKLPPQNGEVESNLPLQGSGTARSQIMQVLRAAEATPEASSKHSSAAPTNILNEDFKEWAKTYSGPKFNFLHCDFPYGVGLFDGNRMSAATEYEDTKEVYFGLIETLCKSLDRLVSSNAHVMFWFSMEYYARTLSLFRKLAPDIVFLPHPLVWLKSDNAGLLPDRNRGPRRIYETALMGIRGERFVAKPVSNAYSAPTERSLHPSTKPEPVLRHFFQLFVDSSTSMLDPTCGAGSAIRVAEEMGASRTLGIERDPEFHGAALGALHRARSLRQISAKVSQQ